jgi:hypothetical protein
MSRCCWSFSSHKKAKYQMLFCFDFFIFKLTKVFSVRFTACFIWAATSTFFSKLSSNFRPRDVALHLTFAVPLSVCLSKFIIQFLSLFFCPFFGMSFFLFASTSYISVCLSAFLFAHANLSARYLGGLVETTSCYLKLSQKKKKNKNRKSQSRFLGPG